VIIPMQDMEAWQTDACDCPTFGDHIGKLTSLSITSMPALLSNGIKQRGSKTIIRSATSLDQSI
jgi:hypothetical protein